MTFSFNANTFRDSFRNVVAEVIADVESDEQDVNSPHNLLVAMDQAVEVMARIDADSAVSQQMNVESIGLLEEKDISQMGQNTLNRLEAMVSYMQTKTGEQSRELIRLSVPVSLWVARHGGKLSQIDMWLTHWLVMPMS